MHITKVLVMPPLLHQVYEFCVLEVLPGKAVSIIECDMKVSETVIIVIAYNLLIIKIPHNYFNQSAS